MQRKILVLVILLVLVQITLFAGTTGKIAGKVTDDDGNPVPFANVILEGTEIGAQTKENGTYIIINVAPGTYNLFCRRGGYKPRKITGVVINMDLTTIQNITISKTAVEIEDFDVSEARVEMVQASKTNSGRTIKAEDIEDISVDDLEGVIAIQSGVTMTGGELHIRGGRSNEVVYTVDGMSVSDPVDGGSALTVDMDAVAYTDVKTGGFTAEYGNAQSGIVNIKTKSGSREYNGKLELITDHIITDKNSSNQDQLKFNIGGPVLTPLVSSLRDKFTFFLNAAGSWSDTRYKDHFVNDPVDELQYLAVDEFSSSDPYADREDFIGFDLGERNSNQYNANLKTKYKINAKQKLTFAARGDRSIFKSFAYSWKYALDHFNAGETTQQQFAGTYDHTFNPQTNLKVKASYYTKQIQQGPDGISRDKFFVKDPSNFDLYDSNNIYECTGINYLIPDPTNPTVGEDSIYDWFITYDGHSGTNPFVKPGSISGFYADDENSIFTFKSDLEYQLNQIHGFKTGVEITQHYIKKDRLSNPWIVNENRYNSYLDEYGTIVDSVQSVVDSTQYIYVYDIDDLYNATIAAAGERDGYEAFPWQGAYYLQDKMEWEGMIVNAGLRFDFWYLGEKYKILQDAGEYVWEDFDDNEKFQAMISPRLGVSHPISETSVMHFAYNYQNQLPQMQYVFTTSRPEDAITSASAVNVGNPSLEPQITVTYEVGLQKQLSEDYVMDIQAYYKNIYNYVSTRKVYDPVDDNVSWYEYFSNDYGSARGIDINFEKRLSNFIMGSTSYSLAWANGNNSDTVIQDVATNLREFPLDWDMRHNYSFNLTFKVSKGEEFYLPFTDFALPTIITDDFSTNLYYNIASGTPYTPTTQTGTTYDTNSDLKPYTESANLKFTKKLSLSKNLKLRAYLKIDNVFNRNNVNWVYPITGSPYYDGADISEPNSTYIADEAQYVHDLYTKNPTAIAQGRTFTMGFAFKF